LHIIYMCLFCWAYYNRIDVRAMKWLFRRSRKVVINQHHIFNDGFLSLSPSRKRKYGADIVPGLHLKWCCK